ncbi:PAS domain-containing protein [Caloramator sp. E03]|uniref:sigma-54 interaction domain-containing protein n=1 Tax=Caloramator sp. E03 TaxID=2576307 RepID=UPI0011108DD2|nr:sigma 54-interacting transcriptional regulator [Caloramator sp. E03]QCX34426.1 PAS domain-containing protein [Caloramator sp. E03]
MDIDFFEISNAIPDGICLTDNKGIILKVNKRFSEITGIDFKEAVGRSIDKLPSQPFLGKINEESQEITLSETNFKNVISIMFAKQKKSMSSLFYIKKTNKQVLLTINLLMDREGKLNQVLHVLRDMSEIIELKEKLEDIEKERNRYINEINYLRNNIVETKNLITNSSSMKKVKEIIDYVAKTDATILITGETGCGKEVVANEIQSKSNRKMEPFIKVNCAAIPESLIEAELFGYEKGAFTGAAPKTKIGMFEMANNGTIFLDEIGELSLSTQTKLLRVLQEKEIIRIGGTKSIKLDVRVLAATNQDLLELIKQRKFREDLYFRLNVVPIKLPPLRERREDIPILAYHFLKEFNLKYNKEKVFHNSAIVALESYNWPGNVRELKNIVERLIIIDDDCQITAEKIKNIINQYTVTSSISKGFTLKETLNMVEKEMIENALKIYGSTHKAAKALGITQPTVFRKAKALNIKLNGKY